MKKFKLVLIWVLFLTTGSYAQNLEFHQVDPLYKVFKERTWYPESRDTLRAAAGETVSVQLVVKALRPIKGLSVLRADATNGRISLSARKGWVTYVPVDRSYYPASRDIIRSVSGYFPDPIVDDTTLNLAAGEVNPLWISVPVPVTAPAGIYKGKVTLTGLVQGKKELFSGEFNIKVYPVTVSETSLWITNWSAHFSPLMLEYLNRGKKVDIYSPLYWELLKVHADMMASHNQNIHRIYAAWNTKFTFKDGKYGFDFSNFDKEAEIFEKAGALKRIEGGHLAWRSGAWDDPFFVEVPLPDDENSRKLRQAPNPSALLCGMRSVLLPVNDERTKNFLSQFLPALKDHLEKRGWLHKYLQHIADEPTSKNAASYVKISSYVKKYLPGVKIMDAVMTSGELKDGVDVWVPVLSVFHKDYPFYEGLRKSGKEIWFYTCVEPRGNYANRFIELPFIQTR